MSFQYSNKNPNMTVTYASTDAMHTRIEVILAGVDNKDIAKDITDSIWDIVKKDENRFNRFSDSSDLYFINAKAGLEEIEVEDEMFMILKMCKIFKSTTEGYFDIAANVISRSCSDNDYTLNDKEHTIKFSNNNVRLDLGGFAKGYTLDKVIKEINQHNIKYGLINFGDSSTYAIGTHPYGDYWPIGIEHPFFPGKNLHEFKLRNNSLSISGKNRKGRPHIIDPMTGNLVSREEMIAVEGASSVITEILSTALYVAPKEIRKNILDRFPGYHAMEIKPMLNGEELAIDI